MLKEIEETVRVSDLSTHASRRHVLDNKMGHCPHCSHKKYVRFGKDKGAQRYKYKSCQRSFTEYTGTWMAGLQRKDMVGSYLELMMEEKSEEGDFTGITESDETFFLRSEKGMEVKDRKPRKRGGKSSKRGVNNDHVAVIATQDRNSVLDLTVATLGRIGKADIEKAIGNRLKKGVTILCSDAHHSYKGFAKDMEMEYHPLNASKGQRVKEGLYHIQQVNSTHNRIKKWIGSTFWGVSAKYPQQYLDWHRIKEDIKHRRDKSRAFVERSMEDVDTLKRYGQIQSRYENLISTQ